MNQPVLQDRWIWSFWGAAALAALGGLMPIVFAGPSGRLSGVAVPFWVAAVAFVGCALVHGQGRTTTSIVYFVAGLAVIFGLLAMFSLPLRLAVLGTCPALPTPCTSGLPRPLTDAENTGMGAAAALAILAVFVGFFGLTVLYRKTTAPPAMPRERRIPPVAPRPTPVEQKTPETREAEEPKELPAPEQDVLPELPAPEPSDRTQ